jgi:hypothetical protein
VRSAFDVAGFVALGRSIGMDLRFASTKETARWRADMGREIPVWKNRALVHTVAGREIVFAGGQLVRFVYDLTNPLTFIQRAHAMDLASPPTPP